MDMSSFQIFSIALFDFEYLSWAHSQFLIVDLSDTASSELLARFVEPIVSLSCSTAKQMPQVTH